MELLKIIKPLSHSKIKNFIVVNDKVSLKDKLYKFYKKVRSKAKDDGMYMIKMYEIQGMHYSRNKIAKRKAYFVSADSGVTFTYSKRDKDIFYSDNYQDILPLAKYLSLYNYTDIFSIVNRKNNGHETFLIPQKTKNKTYDIFIK